MNQDRSRASRQSGLGPCKSNLVWGVTDNNNNNNSNNNKVETIGPKEEKKNKQTNRAKGNGRKK